MPLIPYRPSARWRRLSRRSRAAPYALGHDEQRATIRADFASICRFGISFAGATTGQLERWLNERDGSRTARRLAREVAARSRARSGEAQAGGGSGPAYRDALRLS